MVWIMIKADRILIPYNDTFHAACSKILAAFKNVADMNSRATCVL